MKCVLLFPVIGSLRIANPRPITVRRTIYELVTDSDSVITQIQATVSVPDPARWPTVVNGPQMKLNARLPIEFPFIQQELRATEGLLALFGIESIDLVHIEVKWIPETDEEKKTLHVFGFKYSKGATSPISQQPIDFSFFARAILAAEDTYDDEVPLSFYRHGLYDFLGERYIEAIYDFYFVLEHLFGNGVTKNTGIIREFQKSKQLIDAIKRFGQEPGPPISTKLELQNRFQTFLREHKDANAVCKFMVMLRGKLHHRNPKRRNAWHPDNQAQFLFEAAVFASIVSYVATDITRGYLESEKVSAAIQRLGLG